MRIRILNRPTGLINGRDWPLVGEEMDVPDIAGADLCASGVAEPVARTPAKVAKVAEKRPAAPKGETRKAKG